MKLQYRFTTHSTHLTEGYSLETILTWKYNFNIKICKLLKLQRFVTDILKVKTGLSSELMNGIFELIEKPYSLQINSQFKPDDPNDKIWHRNRKICYRIFFEMNIKLSISLKRDSNTGVFLWNFRNFRKTPILKKICERLLLNFISSAYNHSNALQS